MIERLISYISNKRYKKIKKKLKKEFPDSDIHPNSVFSNCILEGNNVLGSRVNVSGSAIGFATVIGDNSQLKNAQIGRFCSISWGVHVVSPTHPLDIVSTYPSFYNTVNNYPFGRGNVNKKEFLLTDKGRSVEIGNDVWIGENVTIKGGVTIGDGAVIGMSALVTKDVPPYAIVGGVPAKVIRYRFNEKQIESLLKIKWWYWPIEVIKQRKEHFADIDTFIKNFMP